MAKLSLVGLGPGSLDLMSIRAQSVIKQADVVVGYAPYVNMVEPLIDGQKLVKTGMTKEWQRADSAIQLVQQGYKVALVCSGDAGMYAMAPLIFELLASQAINIEVETIPGITAANACASLVGAPLGHDSCTISLSDLLTPWTVITQRIEAAAIADFAITFYNPRSKKRQHHIVEAQQILLKHRAVNTPVAVVNAAYRDEQSVQLSTLESFTQLEFGMNAAVIVGNSSSFRFDDWIVTPRGYRNKYSLADGETRDGQTPGRSLNDIEFPVMSDK
ncbi:precorrin-3B C(17)-methyltransferase [Vibrio panuliri]|uniref:Precorrin-3B C(17)-methyltransferase n=1 Tax=Vibrio panuliri TaxID=1381081 RepID=A0ABX3F6N7_9VIBR|nr:precorrin-3B C(17)-methyltransferase [Vibrio panuliri]KAB1454021.1 precorrin-3B C(17)-methyltransferase [Vibrio panuliri]OLQ84435.1 precorrin-3B C(17)-methyltransferase [Vibrio panuliri]